MDVLIAELDAKLRQWNPDVVVLVRQCILEVIEMADQDVLDIMRSRAVEQEVLDLIDDSETW